MTVSATHQTARIARGKHSSPDDGTCVMELASMLAGERFSDCPRAVCPVLAAYLRAYNDAVDDEPRQALYELAALAVGTRGTRHDRRARRAQCRRKLAELTRGDVTARTPFTAPGTGVATACALAFVRRGDHDGAVAFARELAGLGREAPAPAPAVTADRGEDRELSPPRPARA